MRPIYCGNFEYDARQSDLERLFSRYGKVDRVDMKTGFAFVYMDDERDAEDAIRGLDRTEFGRHGRRLRVEWTKQERGIRRPGGSRRSENLRPAKTLFVINFDPINTRTRDLERHFDPYGKISNIRIRRNFAFIQYESQEDATKALEATNMSKLMDELSRWSMLSAMMMIEETGTVLIVEAEIGPQLGEVVGDLQVLMEELRGPALIMVVALVPTQSLKEEAVQITVVAPVPTPSLKEEAVQIMVVAPVPTPSLKEEAVQNQIMVATPVPTPSLTEEAVQIMAELKVLLMRGTAVVHLRGRKEPEVGFC